MQDIATTDRPRAESHRAGLAIARVRPCPRACHRDRRRRLAAKSRLLSSKARVAPQGPRVFVCPAGGIGIRACLRNMKFRVRIPGGVPDFFTEAKALPPLRQCDRNKRTVLLQLGMWQVQGRHSSTGRARRCQRRGASSRLAGCPIRFRRLTVRTAAFQAANAGSIPAGNATGM